jgi:hypothetical protein
MGAKKLHVRIWGLQQRNDQAPRLGTLLHLKEFVLKAFKVFRRDNIDLGRICLLDELSRQMAIRTFLDGISTACTVYTDLNGAFNILLREGR